MKYNILIFRVIPDVRKEIFAHTVAGEIVTYRTKRNAENDIVHLVRHYESLGGIVTLEAVKEVRRKRIFSANPI